MNLISLPHKKDFLLSLVNNNYSNHTLESYARDLLIFELFLTQIGADFEDLNKILVNEYKGYLRTGKHIEDLVQLKNSLKTEEFSELNLEKLEKEMLEQDILEDNLNTDSSTSSAEAENSKSVDLILEKALATDVLRKSRSKGSRKRQKHIGGLNSRSINRMLSAIRSFLAFLIDIDVKTPIAPEAIKMVKTEKRESQVADYNELIKIIEAPDKYEQKSKLAKRNRAILETLFSTGMRISELVNLDIEDLNYDKADQKINDSKLFVFGKGKKQRYVYLTDRCIHYLERYLEIRDDKYPALFIPYRGKRLTDAEIDSIRVSQRYVQSMIKRYRKLLGIGIPTTPHSLRHGFATYLAEQGANPAAIQRLLGHESLQTTTRYVHSSDRFAERTHQQFHPLSDENKPAGGTQEGEEFK